MAKLSDLVRFKELWESRKENAENAIKFYECEITKEIKESKEENKMIGKALTKVIEGSDGLGTTKVTTHEDKLHYAQEASNNAYMAVHGILKAHAEKNGEQHHKLLHQDIESIENEAFSKGVKHGKKLIGLTFADFDTSVRRTWKKQNFKDAVSNAALGLTGESGEVADLIKKAIYHGRNFKANYDEHNFKEYYRECGTIRKEDVKDELSDVLFYVSAMAQEFGFTLEDVASHNKAKLEKRYEKGFTVEESTQKKDKHEDFYIYYREDGSIMQTSTYIEYGLVNQAHKVVYKGNIIKGGN